jgi:hypothetical protein
MASTGNQQHDLDRKSATYGHVRRDLHLRRMGGCFVLGCRALIEGLGVTMSIIKIQNDTVLDDVSAMYYVMKVVQGGRVSGKDQYCYLTTFKNGIHVYAHRTKRGTDVFRIVSK